MTFPRLLAATDVNGVWHIGIGDPTPIGWFTVCAFLAASISAGMVWCSERKLDRQGRLASPRFWLVLTILLLFLGINKQLDLQTWLQATVRQMAKQNDWYSHRTFYQYTFIGLVTAAGIAMLGLFSWLARKHWARNFVALMGTVILYVFVFIRASSLHHVDLALYGRTYGGVRLNAILELGGIVVTLAGTILAFMGSRTDARRPSRATRADDGKGALRYSFERGVLVAQPDDESATG